MSPRTATSGRAGGRRRASRRRARVGPLLVVALAVALVSAVAGAGAALLTGAGPDADRGPRAPAAQGSGSAAGPEASPGASPESSSEASPESEPAASAARTAAPPPPRPAAGACYDLTWGDVVAYTSTARPVPCSRRHTTRTFSVGALPTLVQGHLLAVDSARARQAPARACPERLREYLGGDPDDLRLSMLRAVWFTPTLEQSDRGADWYRCDVVAVAGKERLAPLRGRLRGVLDRPAAAQYAVCGTAEPGTAGFERVACSGPHRWRAIEVVELRGRDYPGVAAVRAAGQQPCRTAGRELAEDPLSFRWGYEWPTREQWRAGTTWGLCWVPA